MKIRTRAKKKNENKNSSFTKIKVLIKLVGTDTIMNQALIRYYFTRYFENKRLCTCAIKFLT